VVIHFRRQAVICSGPAKATLAPGCRIRRRFGQSGALGCETGSPENWRAVDYSSDSVINAFLVFIDVYEYS
jgi:hypothetical protein